MTLQSIPRYTPNRPRLAVARIKDFLLRALNEARGGAVAVVQVGANDGKLADPILPYLEAGTWRGLLIEPHPLYFAELQARHANRPQIALRNLAISDTPGEMELFHLDEAARDRYPRGLRGCASLERARMEDAVERARRGRGVEVHDDDIAATRVELRRLDSVLEEAGIDRADLVVIDVEGHEMNVLESFDLAALQPTMAVIECNGANRHEEPRIAAAMAAAGLSVVRLGEDLVGLRPGALQIPAEAMLSFLSVRPVA